jgi:hypothetical protein
MFKIKIRLKKAWDTLLPDAPHPDKGKLFIIGDDLELDRSEGSYIRQLETRAIEDRAAGIPPFGRREDYGAISISKDLVVQTLGDGVISRHLMRFNTFIQKTTGWNFKL